MNRIIEKPSQPKVAIYTKASCPFCKLAQELLLQEGITCEIIDITYDKPRHSALIAKTGQRTVPYIFINGNLIGGYRDLLIIKENKTLHELIAPV